MEPEALATFTRGLRAFRDAAAAEDATRWWPDIVGKRGHEEVATVTGQGPPVPASGIPISCDS